MAIWSRKKRLTEPAIDAVQNGRPNYRIVEREFASGRVAYFVQYLYDTEWFDQSPHKGYETADDAAGRLVEIMDQEIVAERVID